MYLLDEALGAPVEPRAGSGELVGVSNPTAGDTKEANGAAARNMDVTDENEVRRRDDTDERRGMGDALASANAWAGDRDEIWEGESDDTCAGESAKTWAGESTAIWARDKDETWAGEIAETSDGERA